MTLTLQAPASKSVSHRAAIAASLAPGRSMLRNMLQSQDLERTLHCLQALGAGIEKHSEGIAVQGLQQAKSQYSSLTPLKLDVGESGTTCRLLTPIAALTRISVEISGRGRMHERPIAELAKSLEDLGCEVNWLQNQGYPPFIIQGRNLQGGNTSINLEQSSQYLSALLLLGPMLAQGLQISIQGHKAVSWPYAALTIRVMQDFGCLVRVLNPDQNQNYEQTRLEDMQEILPGQTIFQVPAGRYQARDYQVEGDWSNASYLLAAGLFLPRGVVVQGLDTQSSQGDRIFLDILDQMGADIQAIERGLQVKPGTLHGAELDMGTCPDLVPTVAILASMAQGATSISNVAHLRLKESDRLQALAQEIVKTGARVELKPDGIDIQPARKPCRETKLMFSTYGDHRLAMALSLYALAGFDFTMDDQDCVQKSFPEFWSVWEKIRHEFQQHQDQQKKQV